MDHISYLVGTLWIFSTNFGCTTWKLAANTGISFYTNRNFENFRRSYFCKRTLKFVEKLSTSVLWPIFDFEVRFSKIGFLENYACISMKVLTFFPFIFQVTWPLERGRNTKPELSIYEYSIHNQLFYRCRLNGFCFQCTLTRHYEAIYFLK